MDKAYLLLRKLRDRDPIVRLQAAQSSELIPVLRETKSSGLRGNIIETLGLIGVDAIETLLTLLKYSNFDFCIHSFARAFSRVGEPAYDLLFEMHQVDDLEQRYRTAIVLGHMGKRSVVDVILDALHNSPKWWIRLAAAETFIIMPSSDVIENLIYALDDPNTEVRTAAAKALGSFGDPQAIPALEAACKVPQNKGNAFSESYTVEYFASGAIRMINQRMRHD